MDSASEFVTCDARIFGLLVPNGCNYMDMVEMISSGLKINTSNSISKIEYDVGGNMAPVRIAKYRSTHYLENIAKLVRAELAPRDVVSRSIDDQLKKRDEKYVLLDISHKPREIKSQF
ncbi:unnamed protein product [Fraxinus pennsylvanica]|uniref:Uncharacterized protein n=1 Tax=Fraxinus pennsylvanica TaxID=56036 RepID=A0AAD2AI85_9LAMI|nr:unnamed protein product [Fraxinus pennsylvanica]